MPSSPEEEAARRALLGIEPQRVSISFQIPQDVLDQAVFDIVKRYLSTSSILLDFLAGEIRKYLVELVPESPEFQVIKEEVREHLRRYPSIDSDPKLAEKVAVAIFGHIQGSTNTYR